MNKQGLILFIYIFLGLCSNFQNNLVRLILISVWGIIPLFLIFINTKTLIQKKSLHYFYLLLFLTFTLFPSLILNSTSFELELKGASVEKLTPFLGLFSLPYFYLIGNDSKFPSSRLRDICIWTVVLFFVLEAGYRYLLSPELFMNYFDRKAAKTIGLLGTTNINGQSLAALFSCLLVIKIKHRIKLLVIIFSLLLTAMARAAIIAVLISILLYSLFKFKSNSKILIFIVSFLILSFFILDPFYLSKDGSFLSKIEFIDSTYALLSKSNLEEFFFGYGMNYELITDTLGVDGLSPHLPILKSFLYFGIFGFIYFIFFNYLIYHQNKKIFFPLITYLILSFAGGPIFWPGIFSISLITIKPNYVYDYNR